MSLGASLGTKPRGIGKGEVREKKVGEAGSAEDGVWVVVRACIRGGCEVVRGECASGSSSEKLHDHRVKIRGVQVGGAAAMEEEEVAMAAAAWEMAWEMCGR